MEDHDLEGAAEDLAAIDKQLFERVAAWNRGDACGFTANFQDGGTFTNITGSVIRGRSLFEQRIGEILRTIFQGSSLRMSIQKLRFVRPDVAIADVDAELTDFKALPPGAQARNRTLHTRQLWVLVKEQGQWQMAAFHNVDVKPGS
jgi:uncharacterized protein (TIGR02246 family)